MTRMLRLALAAFALFPFPQFAFASAGEASVEESAYENLAEILVGTSEQHLEYANSIVTMMIDDLSQKIPPLQLAISKNPSIRQELHAELVPIFVEANQEKRPAMRNALLSVLKLGLTPSQVREIASFYSSPAGIRFANSSMSKFTPERIKADAMAQGSIRSDSLLSDGTNALMNGFANLSEDDRAAVQAFVSSPAGIQWDAIQPEIARVRAAVQNQPSPLQEQKLEQVVFKFFDKYLAP